MSPTYKTRNGYLFVSQAIGDYYQY